MLNLFQKNYQVTPHVYIKNKKNLYQQKMVFQALNINFPCEEKIENKMIEQNTK